MRPAAQSPADETTLRRYLSYLTTTGHPLASALASSRVALLGQGYNNRLYALETVRGAYVLKVYPAGRESRMHRELAALRALEPVGAMPHAVLGDPAARYLDAPVLVYEKISGKPLQAAGLGPADLDQLQAVWLQVHRLPLPQDALLREPAGPATPGDCLTYIDQALQTLRHAALFRDHRMKEAVEQLQMLRHALEAIPPREDLWQSLRLCLCQADSRVGNLLRDDGGKLWLVDWEHAGRMDPAYDMASFFLHPEGLSISEADRTACLRTYGAHTDDLHHLEKISVYMTILPVQWMARVLTMIQDYERQMAQPWVVLRPVEALWEDARRYLGMAHERLMRTSLL
jgi:thiamine kinase-like enzyme